MTAKADSLAGKICRDVNEEKGGELLTKKSAIADPWKLLNANNEKKKAVEDTMSRTSREFLDVRGPTP